MTTTTIDRAQIRSDIADAIRDNILFHHDDTGLCEIELLEITQNVVEELLKENSVEYCSDSIRHEACLRRLKSTIAQLSLQVDELIKIV